MFSDELEMLIEAAIADGKITDKELDVLRKRAEREGVDLDEFNLIINSRLAKKNNEAKERKTSRFTKADYLKMRISNIDYDYKRKIDEIKETGMLVIGNTSDKERRQFEIDKEIRIFKLEKDQSKAIAQEIYKFIIPNDPQDIWDLLVMLKPMMDPDYSIPYGIEVREAYHDKYQECLSMARANFSDDPNISKFLEEIDTKERLENERKKQEEEELSRQTAARLKNEIKNESERLSEKYIKLNREEKEKKIIKGTIGIINGFFLPIEKKDLLGLMEIFMPYSNKKAWKYKDKWPRKLAESYYKKYKEACKIVKEYYPSDPDFNKYIPKPKGLFARIFGK